MRKLLSIIPLVALLMAAGVEDAGAQLLWWKKKKVEQPSEPAAAPVVSPYDKIILNAKGRKTEAGAFTIHKIGDKIYLEVANDKFGREVVLSSYLDRTGDISLAEPGTQAMSPIRYSFEKTDSLVLLRQPTYNVRVTDGEKNIERAIEMSRSGATAMSFPIAAVNLDTTAVVFDATKLLTVSNRQLIDMTGKALSGDFRVSSSRPDTKFAFINSIDATRNSVSVSSETGLKLEATGFMGLITLDMESTVAFTAYLTLLPAERMAPREADNRLGTGYVSFTGFAADGSARPGYFARRIKIEPGGERDSTGLYYPVRPVEIYVDTLFSPLWFDAIKEGIEAWNPAFEGAGFREALHVLPYPTDRDFNANDPTVKTVRFGQGTGTTIGYRTFGDPRTGEIMGFSITVPRDYVQGLRRSALYLIGETDRRYTEYFLADDAVYEGLRADIIRAAGLCLGMAANYAGSHAYSPEQIRDPDFTQRKGFTSSALDGIMFNFVARPGDRDKGVVTVVSKPGIYDEFAVKWLYSPLEGDEKTILDRWLKEKEGDPEYLYVRPQSLRAPYDPRAYPKDLSNDVFTSSDYLLENLKFVMANADRWIDDDLIPAEYKSLLPDYAVLKFDDIIISLCNYIGGIYINETVESGHLQYYEPVAKEIQRKSLFKILSLFDDLSWLDSNPRLLNMAGIDKDISRYVSNYWPVRYIMLRITGQNGAMPLAAGKSPDPYTQAEALDDLAGYIFQDVRKGMEMTPQRFAMARVYIDQLISSVPVLKSNYDNGRGTNSFTGYSMTGAGVDHKYNIEEPPVAAMGTITSFDYYSSPENGALYTEKLKEARRLLRAGTAYCRSQHTRDKYDFYISIIDLSLEGPGN